MNTFFLILFIFYAIAGVFLFCYSLNCYWLIVIFLCKKSTNINENKQIIEDFFKKHNEKDLPLVTTQIPIFNESNVVERVIDTTCNLDYPKDKHQVQILDDSTDECSQISKKLVEKYQKKGYNITFHHRIDRKDYKAGALKEALEEATGEFVTIFDADFVPSKNYLKEIIPLFYQNDNIGLVQARWGHLNADESLLTRSQSIGIDGHFIVEQSARSWGGLYMNFNGTAGTWRKEAIYEAGNWQGDTLTEDMDLSYRAQLKGWKTKFAYHHIVPAEIPNDINAFKSQQYRWAKGSIQTAMKILPKVLVSKESFQIKLQSILHTTHYCIHPLILFTSLFALPLLLYFPLDISRKTLFCLLGVLLFSSFAPSVMYVVSQSTFYRDWKKRLLSLPILMSIGIGIAVNNSFAVFSALSGGKSSFVRTPKSGNKKKSYTKKKPPFSGFLEILLSFYCLFSFSIYIQAEKYIISPFLALYTIAFFTVGVLSIKHSR